jgi:hypothetical protein
MNLADYDIEFNNCKFTNNTAAIGGVLRYRDRIPKQLLHDLDANPDHRNL